MDATQIAAVVAICIAGPLMLALAMRDLRRQAHRDARVRAELHDEIVQTLPNHAVAAAIVRQRMLELGVIEGAVEHEHPPHPGTVYRLAIAYRQRMIDWPEFLAALGYEEGAAVDEGGNPAPAAEGQAAAEA